MQPTRFRSTLAAIMMLVAGTGTVKVVTDILGHNKVSLAMDVYDRTDVEDFVQPLSLVVNELCPSCSPAGTTAMNQH